VREARKKSKKKGSGRNNYAEGRGKNSVDNYALKEKRQTSAAAAGASTVRAGTCKGCK